MSSWEILNKLLKILKNNNYLALVYIMILFYLIFLKKKKALHSLTLVIPTVSFLSQKCS